MAQSYAEIKGKRAFNWYRFLRKKNYTEHELLLAKRRAGEWVTCAAGTQCAIIPRQVGGTPKDPELYHLGIQFYSQITSMYSCLRYGGLDLLEMRRQRSLETLEQIEERSFELLVEITDKQT